MVDGRNQIFLIQWLFMVTLRSALMYRHDSVASCSAVGHPGAER